MFNKSEKHNPNYLASIVKIESFRPHSNADKLKVTSLFGNNVITGINAENGIYCYFPLECAISNEFLSYTNSFRDKDLNRIKEQKGLFEENSRVKAVKLRGEKSEGYIVPVSQLESFAKDVLNQKIEITEKYVGSDFDLFFDHSICKKYIPKGMRNSGEAGKKKTKGNVKKYASRLVENQFNFHQDTSHLKREMHRVSPDDYISVTEKLHGCNFIVSNVLVKRKLSLVDRVSKFFGANVTETEYGMLYSSRAVIKNSVMDDGKVNNNFYDTDVWKIVADKIFPSLAQGISVVGEIVGYTPSGSAIQKNYDYGCSSGDLDFWIFKVTHTSACGKVYVFNHRETVEFCQKFNFKMPQTHYYGKAKDYFPEISVENHWHDNFLQKMIEVHLEKKCTICKNDVWAEGVILRKDSPFEWDAFKLKSFNFLEGESKQLDSGEVDIETAESSQTE
jgi:tRNA-binding EMAP/Myf-like protein